MRKYASRARVPVADSRAQVVHAFKTVTAPDGVPVMAPTAWCIKYKPGREGETP
jgi:hypothetical protein